MHYKLSLLIFATKSHVLLFLTILCNQTRLEIIYILSASFLSHSVQQIFNNYVSDCVFSLNNLPFKNPLNGFFRLIDKK